MTLGLPLRWGLTPPPRYAHASPHSHTPAGRGVRTKKNLAADVVFLFFWRGDHRRLRRRRRWRRCRRRRWARPGGGVAPAPLSPPRQNEGVRPGVGGVACAAGRGATHRASYVSGTPPTAPVRRRGGTKRLEVWMNVRHGPALSPSVPRPAWPPAKPSPRGAVSNTQTRPPRCRHSRWASSSPHPSRHPPPDTRPGALTAREVLGRLCARHLLSSLLRFSWRASRAPRTPAGGRTNVGR